MEMKGLDLLDALIKHYEQSLEIAQNEIQNNINWTGNAGRGWLKDKAIAEKNLKFLSWMHMRATSAISLKKCAIVLLSTSKTSARTL